MNLVHLNYIYLLCNPEFQEKREIINKIIDSMNFENKRTMMRCKISTEKVFFTNYKKGSVLYLT